MMNVPPSEAECMSLYDYEALLWNWNESHKSGDELEAPDPEITEILLAKANADPRLTGPAPAKTLVN